MRRIRGPTMKEIIFQEKLNLMKENMQTTLQKKRIFIVQEITKTRDNMLQTLAVVSDINSTGIFSISISSSNLLVSINKMTSPTNIVLIQIL